MSAQHTPGPWRHSTQGRFAIVVGDHPVPGVKGSDEVAYYGGHLIAESVAPQNAPLIAASPDLLALVRQYRNDLLYPPAPDSVQRRIAAIDAVLRATSTAPALAEGVR